jgi:hypothetical protein
MNIMLAHPQGSNFGYWDTELIVLVGQFSQGFQTKPSLAYSSWRCKRRLCLHFARQRLLLVKHDYIIPSMYFYLVVPNFHPKSSLSSISNWPD